MLIDTNSGQTGQLAVNNLGSLHPQSMANPDLSTKEFYGLGNIHSYVILIYSILLYQQFCLPKFQLPTVNQGQILHGRGKILRGRCHTDTAFITINCYKLFYFAIALTMFLMCWTSKSNFIISNYTYEETQSTQGAVLSMVLETRSKRGDVTEHILTGRGILLYL